MGIRYKYIKNGNKPVVLFLHGWGGNENSFDNIYYQLSSNFSVISINLTDITHGYINKPLTMHDYIVNILCVLNNLKINSCHIVCHSFGFRVALLLNRDSYIHIDSMVVIDGAGIRYQSVLVKCKILVYKFKKKLVKKGVLSNKILQNSGSNDYIILNDNDKTTFKNIVNYDLKKSIKLVNCDTLIVWGKYDYDTPIKCARYIAKNILGAKCVIYNTGHFSYIENRLQFAFDIDEHFRKYLTI